MRGLVLNAADPCRLPQMLADIIEILDELSRDAKPSLPGGVIHKYTDGRLGCPPPEAPPVDKPDGQGEPVGTSAKPPGPAQIHNPTTGASSPRPRTPPHSHPHNHNHAMPYGNTGSTVSRSASPVVRAGERAGAGASAGTTITGLPGETTCGTTTKALAVLGSPSVDDEIIDVGKKEGHAGGFMLSDESVEPEAGCGLVLCGMFEFVTCVVM
jgi:hypothetical protein